MLSSTLEMEITDVIRARKIRGNYLLRYSEEFAHIGCNVLYCFLNLEMELGSCSHYSYSYLVSERKVITVL